MSNNNGPNTREDMGPVETITHIVGQRLGKGYFAAAREVFSEATEQPPVSSKEAEVFCRIHIKRCNVNLANAKDRGDKRAIIHLRRKLAVYEYLFELVQKQTSADKIETCPNCRVSSIGETGTCPCCGQTRI